MLPFIFFRKKVRNRLHKSKTFCIFAPEKASKPQYVKDNYSSNLYY